MENREENYDKVMERIGKDNFRSRLSELLVTARDFINKAGYGECVECNERIMFHVLLDTLSDIYRLEEFHSIEHPRTEKIFAYTLTWILRRKPLQFVIYDKEERDIFVNERFALFLMVNECMGNGEKNLITDSNVENWDDYMKLMLYYFKYRNCNPQAIELAIESFKMGTLME